MSNIFDKCAERFEHKQAEEFEFNQYLDMCKTDPSVYATAAERLLTAIGDPVLVDTRKDERLSRIFTNRKIKTYPKSFAEFYGAEDTIEQIVSFFKHAAQGLEESKQILYLLGPVGGGKSSLAEQLKKLMETIPFYSLEAFNQATNRWEVSPIYESPLGVFDVDEDGPILFEQYGIPKQYLRPIMSPWATKRLEEAKGDMSQFKVVKLWPSTLNQTGITKVEPGDDNNQDISNLVGKVNIRMLEDLDQNDPDAYNWAGGLNTATQGVLEFVEMFKAPIKMLHPLLTATQEGHYNGTEQFGAIPFQGIILAHSNESEWQEFKHNKTNEAFIDRVCIVKVPYCLRVSDEIEIYKKIIADSRLKDAPVAAGTYEMMAQYSIMTRLNDTDVSSPFSKMEIYDGKNLKDKDPQAKSLENYKDMAGVNEGMDGSSTRFAYKILSRVFNFDPDEIAANPIHLMFVLQKQIEQEQLSPELEDKRLALIKGILAPNYSDFLGGEMQKAYLESYHDYGQNLFDRYVQYADFWVEDKDYRDPGTGENFDRSALNAELEKLEKPAGITNAKDFRNEITAFVLRQKANNGGESPVWTSYEKLREVIEKKMFSNTDDLLPVISFGKKATTEEEEKHNDFVKRMMEGGQTEKQVRLSVEWYMRYKKNH
jgi:serine protein kinase